MARRPGFLPALAGAMAALVLAGTVPGSAPAAAAEPAPAAPSVSTAAEQADGRTVTRATGKARRTGQARAAKRRQAEDAYDAPLEITIDELTPGELPRRGPLVVSGTVTNVDLETWEDVTLYPMFGAGPGCDVCTGPMTTAAELAGAAESDPEAPVGVRHTEVRDDIPVLQPGQSASYTLRIPQRALRLRFPAPGTGVYWFGVHALGGSETSPRDLVADGRARTFLPSVSARAGAVVDTAVVVPLRARIAHSADGRLGRTAAWQRALALPGSLGGTLAFGAAASGDPVTWLVDPALPDAVRHLARGNPPREVEVVPKDPESPSDEASSEGTEEPEGDGAPGDKGPSTVDEALVRMAEDWLRRAEGAFRAGQVAALPYGDPDIAAAAGGLPTLYGTARAREGGTLDEWGVAGTPAVAPPNGYLDEAGIESIDDGALILLGDQAFPSETSTEGATTTATVGGRPVVVRSSGAAEGGPGPNPRLTPVALRQRLLSEAAVRLAGSGSANPAPLVVVLPSGLQAAGAASFWDGLDLGWLRQVSLATVVDQADGATSEEIDPADLSYPADQMLLEIESSVLGHLDGLIRAARSLQSILGKDYRIAGQLLDEALAGASYSLRNDPQAGPRLARSRAWVEDQLDRVTLDAPNGVTLSSTAGGFNVSVRNALDYPVTVRIAATTDSGALIGVANPVELAANSRSSVPITADMSRPGVHNVRLRLTDLDGRSIGAADELPIRSGQAGVVIWAIIGTGLGILFVAIVIRLYRRLRAHRRGSGDGRSATASTSGESA